MKTAKHIYIINALLIVAYICMFTHIDNGQHLLITILFCILTTAVMNTIVMYVYHFAKIINLKTLQFRKALCLCALLTLLPLLTNDVLLKYFNDYIFYDIVSPGMFSHERYTWSSPLFLQLYVYVMLALALLVKSTIHKKRR